MTYDEPIKAFWLAYLESLPSDADRPGTYTAWSFGDTAEMADELGNLVVIDQKTATCSLLWVYESEKAEPLPKAGDLSIILNGSGKPLCLIETTEVTIRPFNQVDENFAYDEGEGDRSLTYWRQVHWRFFSRECTAIGRQPSPTMPLVCERFRRID